MSPLRFALPLACVLLAPAAALAEEDVDPAPEPDVEPSGVTREDAVAVSRTLGGAHGSARSMASSWLILPEGSELSGELRLLTTAQRMPDGEPLRLTDVAVTRLSGRRSIKGKAELAGSLDLLPKQPAASDELVIQGGGVSGRLGFKRRYAAYAGVAGGPLTADQGYWTAAAAGVQRRSIVHDTLSFQLGVGGSVTPMFFADEVGGGTAWVAEVVARGQTLWQVEGMWGLWVGADFAFPVAHRGGLMGGAFDPQTRVDLQIGTVYSVVPDWDVYVELTIVDRGEMAAPATQLPILQGGFDQRVVTFGVTRHLGKRGRHRDLMLAY